MPRYDHAAARELVLGHLKAHPVGLTIPEIARGIGWPQDNVRAVRVALNELDYRVRPERVDTPGQGIGFKTVWFPS